VQIIAPRMQELFQLVHEELERAGCLGRIPDGLDITGGGSQLQGCVDIARQVMDLPVRIGRPSLLGGLGETLTHPSYATAVGLVEYGARRVQAAQRAAHSRGTDAPLRVLRRLFLRLFGR
jgi:cell division protein FtsA